jgi:predicted 3-demethylubiquinone-9 3-methyltransferase (glyoxalase superfamily)
MQKIVPFLWLDN